MQVSFVVDRVSRSITSKVFIDAIKNSGRVRRIITNQFTDRTVFLPFVQLYLDPFYYQHSTGFDLSTPRLVPDFDSFRYRILVFIPQRCPPRAIPVQIDVYVSVSKLRPSV